MIVHEHRARISDVSSGMNVCPEFACLPGEGGGSLGKVVTVNTGTAATELGNIHSKRAVFIRSGEELV